MESCELEFRDEAHAIAQKAVGGKREQGATFILGILDTMYGTSSENASKVVDEASIAGESKPLIIFENTKALPTKGRYKCFWLFPS